MNIISIGQHLICAKDYLVVNEEVNRYDIEEKHDTTSKCLGKESTNHEYICVQTLDGVLYVFENERQSMAKSLPNTYLPGPIAYLSRHDAFLTVSSNYQLECYK